MSHPSRNHVKELAAKAGAGNSGARLQLRKQMESQMAYIVRRTLQSGKAVTPLDRRIFEEARRLNTQTPWQLDHRDLEQRVRAIADAMCNNVLANLRPTAADGRQAAETVIENAPSMC